MICQGQCAKVVFMSACVKLYMQALITFEKY